jgi:hypothetical protein
MAGPAAARPALRVEATGAGMSVAVTGVARCDAMTGEWWVFWGMTAWSAGVSLDTVRDETNNYTYALPQTLYSLTPGNGRGVYGLRLPGTANEATLTVTFASPAGAAPVTRRLMLSGGCARQEVPACVPYADAHYQHSVDAVSGTVTIGIVGAPSCAQPPAFVYVSEARLSNGGYRSYASVWPVLGANGSRFTTKAAMLLDTPPCASRRYLFAAGMAGQGPLASNILAGSAEAPGNRSSGPVIGEVTDQGTCIDPTVRFWSTRMRTGARTWAPAIQKRSATAKTRHCPQRFLLSYHTEAGVGVVSSHQAAPGGTTVITLSGLSPRYVSLEFPLIPPHTAPDVTYTWTAPPPTPRRLVRP